jgi:hypothetical protein
VFVFKPRRLWSAYNKAHNRVNGEYAEIFLRKEDFVRWLTESVRPEGRVAWRGSENVASYLLFYAVNTRLKPQGPKNAAFDVHIFNQFRLA